MRATLKLTTTALGQRSFGKLASILTHLSVGRVRLPRDLPPSGTLTRCAGTGGTIAGTGQFLKEYKPDIKIVLADPEGSGLYNKVRFNVMFDVKESEGTKRRCAVNSVVERCQADKQHSHQVDTVVEGIGINRVRRL